MNISSSSQSSDVLSLAVNKMNCCHNFFSPFCLEIHMAFSQFFLHKLSPVINVSVYSYIAIALEQSDDEGLKNILSGLYNLYEIAK